MLERQIKGLWNVRVVLWELTSHDVVVRHERMLVASKKPSTKAVVVRLPWPWQVERLRGEVKVLPLSAPKYIPVV